MATAAPIVALAAAALALLGLAGAYLGLLSPLMGFQTFAGGALLGGLVSVIVSLIALFLARGGEPPGARTKALVGLAVGLGLLLVVLLAAAPGGGLPPINDITTDLENPPAFAAANDVPEYAGRDMSYPPEFVAQVRQAYPDLEPLRVEGQTPVVYAQALEAAESLGWTIVSRNPNRGTFDARDETALFRFVDDVSVRVVEDGSEVRVDMRSKSRDGRGDLGANAARIRAFMEEMQKD